MSNKDLHVIRAIFAPYDPAPPLLAIEAPAPSPDQIIAETTPLAGSPRRPAVLTRRGLLGGAAAAGIAAAGVAAVRQVVAARDARELAGSARMIATPRLLAFESAGSAMTARHVLLAMAARAEQQPDTTGSGRYQYTETRGWYLDNAVSGTVAASAVVPVTTRQWIAADDSGRLSKTTGAPYFPTARDRQLWLGHGGPQSLPGPSDSRLGPGRLHLMWQPGSLSNDAAVLRRQLRAGHPASNGPAETLTAVSDLYSEQPVPPGVRAAVLRVLASLPGLTYDGPVTDRAGRRGVGVSTVSGYTGLPTRFILVFDPDTGQLLDSEQDFTTTAGKLHVTAPCVIAYTVYLRAGRTDSLDSPA